MSLIETRQEADRAEAKARQMAEVVMSAAKLLAGTDLAEVAGINAETAALVIQNAQTRARLIEAKKVASMLADLKQQSADLLERAEDGEIEPEAGLASLDRLREQLTALPLAMVRRDAWTDAVAKLAEMTGYSFEP